ncbi:secA translation cis-regulator SecM [Gallibacterium melopsittaci]|uniref:SecA translation cis-regulator SecM n=1 Tax=Gallibacterium melopsittaci TaxID=516063 RepID=A0ABV6HUN1_9PAST
MDYQFTKVGKKTLWQRLLLGVLTLFFLPIHAEQPNQATTITLETNQTVSAIQQQQINSHFLLLRKVQQQIDFSRNKIKNQPQFDVVQQYLLSQVNRYQIQIRAGPQQINL